MSNPEIPDTECHTLALWLENKGPEIVTEWTKAVRDDPLIPGADQLTLAALQDHFPQMLGELLVGLQDETALADAESRHTAAQHGTTRWRQGYRLDEILRELARIREMI